MPHSLESKVRAILEQAAPLALELQQTHPELADIWRDPEGPKREDLARIVLHDAKASLSVAIQAVYFAIHGNPYDRLATPPFPGLIPKEEAVRSTRERWRHNGEEQLARKAGIHAQTDEERSDIGRMGGIASVRAGGKRSWYAEHPLEEGSESLYLFERVLGARLYKEGRRQRRVLASKAAEEVNAKFNRARSARDVKSFFYQHKEIWTAFQAVYGTPFVPKRRPSRSEARRRVLRGSGLYSWKDTAPDGRTYLEHLFELALDDEYQQGTRYKTGRMAATMRREYGLRCGSDAVTSALRNKYCEEFLEFRKEHDPLLQRLPFKKHA